MGIDVKTTRGRVHIPQFVEAYIYDAANPREYVEFINRHVDLAKDCLCQEFLIDSYSIRVDNVFIEYECLQPAQAVKLLDGTGLTTRRRPAQQP